MEDKMPPGTVPTYEPPNGSLGQGTQVHFLCAPALLADLQVPVPLKHTKAPSVRTALISLRPSELTRVQGCTDRR
jgi:hypothetical protein